MDVADLSQFDHVCRLFPLPQVVLFPHAVVPLHIFEPRYRQMTEDSLASGDRLITMVRLLGSDPPLGGPPPAIEDVGCLGRIVRCDRLADGRFNFLLLGLKRVRLTREVSSPKLYRLAEAELLEDREAGPADGARRDELIALFRRTVRAPGALDPDLASMLGSELPLGVLTDIVAHALEVSAEVKQVLLAELHVARRAELLEELLRQALAGGPSAFPPPFSVN